MQYVLSASVFNFLRDCDVVPRQSTDDRDRQQYDCDPGYPTHRRVVLWNNNPSEGARLHFGGCEYTYVISEHQNLFRAIKELRQKLLEKQRGSYWSDDQVRGLHCAIENSIVWPVTPTYEPPIPGCSKGASNAERLDRYYAEHDCADQGLALAPVWRHERWQAFLYTLLPKVPLDEIPDRAYLDTFKCPNLFLAAERLETIVEQRETERGVRLAGLHDSSPLWPKGL